MNRKSRARPILGALIAALVASSTLAPGCGDGGAPGRAPTATEEVYNSREKAILERNASRIKKPQAPKTK